MAERVGSKQNFLLAALPLSDYKRFTAELKRVRLSLGATVYKADVPPHCFLPASCPDLRRCQRNTAIAITG
jgi:hypothetical protein